MADIFIAYTKEQKGLVKKLSAKLETEGYSCWVESRDLKPGTDKEEAFKTAISETKILLLVFSVIADKSEEMMLLTDLAAEYEIPVIPFIVSDVDLTVSMQHFLGTHDWINAFDRPFEEAYEDVKELIAETLTGDPTAKPEPRPKKNNKNIQTENKKLNPKYLLAGAAAVVILIFAIYVFSDNNSASANSQLVGVWHMVDYQDNMVRNKQDSIALMQQVTAMKAGVELRFNEDGTFSRKGFQPNTESGKWSYDEQKKILKLQALNVPTPDMVTLQSLSDNTLVIVVVENVDNKQVVTKLTFRKI